MHTQTILEQARQARRAGTFSAAEACYRECLGRHGEDPVVLQELASLLLELRRAEEASVMIERALVMAPDSPQLLFTRAMLRRMQDRREDAHEDLDRVLVLVPGHPAALLNRGALRSDLGRLDGALEDFERLRQIEPQQVEGHYNAGVTLSRLDRHGEAIQALRQACRLTPRIAPVRRALGNALRGAGRLPQALEALRECVALDPRDATNHGDYGTALLAAGEPSQAIACFREALRLNPRDQTALAGLYLASNEAGDREGAGRLLDPVLIGRRQLLLTEVGRLRTAVLEHPQLNWEPSGKTTRSGEQTAFLDLSPGSPFADHGAQVAEAVSHRIQELAADRARSTHPWMRGRLSRWRLRMWATVLRQGGHQAPHIHPSGWMSGVFYLDDGNADPAAGQGGTIVFGRGPDELSLKAAPLEFAHQPATGELLLFPSYFHHHTVPFRGSGVRISLAFDVVPRG